MERLLKLLAGYVRISVEGEQLERFLNLCRARGILLRKIKVTGERRMTAILSLRDFFQVRPARSKTKVHIRVEKKSGLPFFLHRNRKRKAFFLGGLLGLLLLALLSSRIWNIHIQGNVINSTPTILKFLEEEGIVHGIARKKVNCYQLAELIRRRYPEITWVSVRMEGTRLILTIQEGLTAETEKTEEEACSLLAEVDGEIVRMITRAGTPLARPGDTCRKGDVLVLGSVEIRNDSQEVIRTEYVHADADIYVRHELSYYHEFPLAYQKETATGREKRSCYLKLGAWYFGSGTEKKEGWRRAVWELPFRITENFTMPAALGIIRDIQYNTEEALYSEEQARSLAIRRLHRYEEKLMQKGVQISGNNVKIKVDGTACVSHGTLTVIEKTGAETAAERQEQLTERTTAQDGQ